MLKIEKDYIEKYGEISKEQSERLDELISNANLSRYKVNVYDEVHRIFNIPWKTFKFIIYLEPKATPRPRSGRNGVFYVKGAKDNKKFFEKNFIKREDIPLITTPTKFICKSYLPIPNSMHPVEKILAEMGFIHPVSKPDWDNLAKAYCDMIQGYILYDDSLIVEGTSIKRYSTKPRIEIEISYMVDYDSNFNKKKIRKVEK